MFRILVLTIDGVLALLCAIEAFVLMHDRARTLENFLVLAGVAVVILANLIYIIDYRPQTTSSNRLVRLSALWLKAKEVDLEARSKGTPKA